jgi:hypothetical protein
LKSLAAPGSPLRLEPQFLRDLGGVVGLVLQRFRKIGGPPDSSPGWSLRGSLENRCSEWLSRQINTPLAPEQCMFYEDEFRAVLGKYSNG